MDISDSSKRIIICATIMRYAVDRKYFRRIRLISLFKNVEKGNHREFSKIGRGGNEKFHEHFESLLTF